MKKYRNIGIILCMALLIALASILMSCGGGESHESIEIGGDVEIGGDTEIGGDVETEGDDIGSGEFDIVVDKNGFATWTPIEGAVAYEYCFVYDQNGVPTTSGPVQTSKTELQIPRGHALHIRPVFRNGEIGDWHTTEIFGNADDWKETDVPVDPGTDHPVDPGTPPPIDPPTEIVFHIDDNGVATWDAVEGVTHYLLSIIYFEDEVPVCVQKMVETEPVSISLQDGYLLEVIGHVGDTASVFGRTEIYGDPALRATWRRGPINPAFDVCWEDVKEYEVISNIDQSSVKVAADGTVTFEATGPDGGRMRFYGKGVRVLEGEITMMPGAFLTALDAIGRIMCYEVAAEAPEELHSHFIFANGGYTFSDQKHVDSYRDLTYATGHADYVAGSLTAFTEVGAEKEKVNGRYAYEICEYQPNFISLSGIGYGESCFSLHELHVFYVEGYTASVEYAMLYADFYGSYIDGERYFVDKETSAYSPNVPTFYLVVKPQLLYEREPSTYEEWMNDPHRIGLYTVSASVYEIGELRDAEGQAVDKQTARIREGMTLDLGFGDQTVKMALPFVDQFTTAKVMHDLVPYAFPEAVGTLNALVIPIGWQDEPEHADDDEYALFRAELGRVLDADGRVTDYSPDPAVQKRFSLSDYYDIASYGKLNVQSFMTDWYRAPYNFSEMRDRAPDMTFTDELLDWLYATYPDMDFKQFDRDGNGYFDAVILLNAGSMGGSYNIISFGGGIWNRYSYTGEYEGTPERPSFNGYINMNAHLFKHNTLIHEFAHGLGLIDYYDVTYSGIDAVGSFDMQSSSKGDWNVYSKYAVGWLTPKTVTGLASGQSIEIEIGASALTGDAIVIPGAKSDYNGTPFDEYIMIDLFADAGVNVYDTADGFDLTGAVGVRIYHVDARMERRELTVEGKDEVYPIGTVHTANNNTGDGKFNIELIQAGGDNTFTDMSNRRTMLNKDDLFDVGDSFTVEGYSEFFEDGLFNDGTAFGYKIEIVSLTRGERPTAIVRITAQ